MLRAGLTQPVLSRVEALPAISATIRAGQLYLTPLSGQLDMHGRRSEQASAWRDAPFEARER